MSGEFWTKEDTALLVTLLDRPALEIAQHFPGRTVVSIRSKVKRLREDARTPESPKPEPPTVTPPHPSSYLESLPDPQTVEEVKQKLEEENAELRKTARTLQRQLATAKAKTADLVEAVHEAAREAATVVGAPAIIIPKHDPRRNGAEIALLHCTDWQVGKVTESYSTDVARDRITLLIEKVIQLTEIERAAHPVRECVILLGGDMCEGTAIFPGQPYLVDSQLYDQLFNTAHIIESMIRSLASSFESLDLWTVFGNHGRLGRKGDYARGDNVDQIIYRIIADRMTDVSHVHWHIGRSWYQIAPLGNYRALLIHGDQIKSSGGTPAFAIMSRANRWASGVIEQFSDMYMGHFHQPMGLPLARGKGQVYMSPSIESSNEYAKEFVSATGTPGQRLHFVNPERGRVTTERLVWLDDEPHIAS